MRAQDEANIRSMQEQREMQDIAGLSSQFNAGNQMLFQGLGGIAQTGMATLGHMGLKDAIAKQGAGVGTDKTTTTTSPTTTSTPNAMNEAFGGLNNTLTRTGGSGLGAMNYLDNQPLFGNYNLPSLSAPATKKTNVNGNWRGYSVDPYSGNLIFE